MRVIVEIRTADAAVAAEGLAECGFVPDEGSEPKQDEKNPDRSYVVGEIPVKNLDRLQKTFGVFTWHVVGMEP